jgi:matrixin
MKRLAFLIALCALPKTAQAGYCLLDPASNQTYMHWPNHTVTFKINSASLASVGGDAARTAIVNAFQAWASAPCADFQIVDGGDTTNTTWNIPGSTDTGAIDVFFATDTNTWGQQGSNTQYIASTFYNHTQQTPVQFVNATIMFNAVTYQYSTTPSSTQLDIQEVAMREIGRMLGLIPNPTDTSSIMYGPIPFGETSRRSISTDDQNAMAYLYPQASPQGACASIPPPLTGAMCPDNTGGSTGGSGGGGAGGNPGGGAGGAGGSGGVGGSSGSGGAGGGQTGGSGDSGCAVGGHASGFGMTALALLATLALCATRRRR